MGFNWKFWEEPKVEPVVAPVELPKVSMTGLPVSVVVVPPGVNPERKDRNQLRYQRLCEHIDRESAQGVPDYDLASHIAERDALKKVIDNG